MKKTVYAAAADTTAAAALAALESAIAAHNTAAAAENVTAAALESARADIETARAVYNMRLTLDAFIAARADALTLEKLTAEYTAPAARVIYKDSFAAVDLTARAVINPLEFFGDCRARKIAAPAPAALNNALDALTAAARRLTADALAVDSDADALTVNARAMRDALAACYHEFGYHKVKAITPAAIFAARAVMRFDRRAAALDTVSRAAAARAVFAAAHVWIVGGEYSANDTAADRRAARAAAAAERRAEKAAEKARKAADKAAEKAAAAREKAAALTADAAEKAAAADALTAA